ncbi:AraC family ligand binding domain-containing protein [Terasakiella sp.]|uniref:AraC family ligand binding domain-containing protein n=1 Tax=Terasakiella sp. TaxID=2034861 RepID=UPI003AA84525
MAGMVTTKNTDWVNLQHDHRTGVETLHAHFEGHAYDPHLHDTYVIGLTESGIQQFNCRHKIHNSLKGGCFLIEPGEIHDGHAPYEGGFTYRSLNIPEKWLHDQISDIFCDKPDKFELTFNSTLSQDHPLACAVSDAFRAKHMHDPDIVQEACMDTMLQTLTRHMNWRQKEHAKHGHYLAYRIREYINANIETDMLVQDIALDFGYDRFQITRAFKNAFGISPHAYLIQLRLARARTLLSQGHAPSDVAHRLCFADQSHLGRWFKRAYRLTPSAYAKNCTDIPD